MGLPTAPFPKAATQGVGTETKLHHAERQSSRKSFVRFSTTTTGDAAVSHEAPVPAPMLSCSAHTANPTADFQTVRLRSGRPPGPPPAVGARGPEAQGGARQPQVAMSDSVPPLHGPQSECGHSGGRGALAGQRRRRTHRRALAQQLRLVTVTLAFTGHTGRKGEASSGQQLLARTLPAPNHIIACVLIVNSKTPKSSHYCGTGGEKTPGPRQLACEWPR